MNDHPSERITHLPYQTITNLPNLCSDNLSITHLPHQFQVCCGVGGGDVAEQLPVNRQALAGHSLGDCPEVSDLN